VLRSVVRAVLVAGLIAAVGLALGIRYLARPDAAVPPSPFVTKWRYPTEQDWIVAHVAMAIADMAQYARNGAAPDAKALDVDVETVTGPGPAVFTVRVRGHEPARLTASEHIWSPAMYAPLATALLGPAAPAATAAPPPSESATFAALTRPRTDVIVAESARVSSALASRMTDAAAHEDAALLYAALGLREWAGQYYDNHRTLCRLAAHLAMAEALRKGAEPGPSARIAEATLLTLTFRDQRGVLHRLEAVEASPGLTSAARAWSRTLRMRNTEDWRLLPDPEHASLLERREYFVWLNSKLGHSHALEYLDRTDPDGLSDWGSVIMSVGYSVEAGHRFVPAGLAAVMSEVSQMPLDVAGGPAALVRALNEEPAPGPVRTKNGGTVVEVIDTGTWADFAERHLMHHIETGVDCMRRMWGLREGADPYKAQMQAAFGGLRQFPIAARRLARSRAECAAAMPAAVALLLAGPELGGRTQLEPPAAHAGLSRRHLRRSPDGDLVPAAVPGRDLVRMAEAPVPARRPPPDPRRDAVFQAAPLVCRRCGGPLKVVAYITHTVAIRRILDHLGLSPLEKPPPEVREIVRVPVDDEGRQIGANPA